MLCFCNVFDAVVPESAWDFLDIFALLLFLLRLTCLYIVLKSVSCWFGYVASYPVTFVFVLQIIRCESITSCFSITSEVYHSYSPRMPSLRWFNQLLIKSISWSHVVTLSHLSESS